MKTIVKRIIPFIITLCVVISAVTITASAASSSIAFSKSKLEVGGTLTVTARFSTSSNDPMYGLECYIVYDPEILQYVSGDNCSLLSKGKIKVIQMSDGKTNLSQNVKFKAVKAGSSVVSVESIVYPDKDDVERSIKASSAKVTVTNPSAAASSNANLKGITVSDGTLTPKFDPNVTSYSVTVGNSVTELWVSVSKADSKATYTVEGSREMKVGNNVRTIIVTAENGKTKSYTINITRLDETGNVPENQIDEPVNNVIQVMADGQTMYIQENFATDSLPNGFSLIDYAYDSKTIPAISDGTYILVYLSMPDGSWSDFYVVSKNHNFARLVTLQVGGQNYYILPAEKTPAGYTLVEAYEILGKTIPVYKSQDANMADFVTVYAKGPGGKNSFYNFDTVDQTMQRAVGVGEEKTEQVENNEPSGDLVSNFIALNINGKIVAITIVGIILLLVIAIVVLVVKIATAGKNKAPQENYNDYLYDNSAGFEYVSINGVPEAPDTPQEIESEISENTESTQEDSEEETEE